MLTTLLFMLAAGTGAQATDLGEEPNPTSMSRSEIRAYNATISKNHPYYIRCVKSADTGSLIERNFSCRTNQQWARSERIGNQNARDTVESMQSKASNTSS